MCLKQPIILSHHILQMSSCSLGIFQKLSYLISYSLGMTEQDNRTVSRLGYQQSKTIIISKIYCLQCNGPFQCLQFYVCKLANLLSNCYTEIIHSHWLTWFAQKSTCLCLWYCLWAVDIAMNGKGVAKCSATWCYK
jgi:hypothetical protein